MKKAFDQNVSRTKPRLRLGAALAEVAPDEIEFAREVMAAPSVVEPVVPDLGAQVRARVEQAHAPRPTASEAMQRALGASAAEAESGPAEAVVAEAAPVEAYRPLPPAPVAVEPAARLAPKANRPLQVPVASVEAPRVRPAPVAVVSAPPVRPVSAPAAHAAPPPSQVEVQTPSAPAQLELSPEVRRERLKERLQAVRENPRPEPLPPTVAEAGVLAVERIATLQAELGKLKAVNLALAQDLESARRQAERATEEARLRMDEARRLSTEMEARAKLLSDLERELSSLEGERDEALLALQESRQTLEANSHERESLRAEIAKREQSLADSLSEEERLAGELEAAHDDATSLRRALDALRSERDTLARQVGDLTVERADLLEARKALQAVHKALSHAVVR